MADPLSITGLVLQLGSVLKQLYEYGKKVSEAKGRLLSLCSELAAFKSVLTDVEPIYKHNTADLDKFNVTDMIVEANVLVDDLAKQLSIKQTPAKRAMQFLKFPLNETFINEVLSKLERWKSTLLLALMTEEHSISTLMHSDVKALKELVEDDVGSRKAHQKELQIEKLVTSVAPISPDNPHRKACERWKADGRSSWFLDGPVTAWARGVKESERMMMLMGKSGAGKTTLLSQAIEKVRSDAKIKSAHVGYFYCTYDDTASQELQNILGSLVVQTCSDLEQLTKRVGDLKGLETEVVIDMFKQELLDVKGTLLLLLDAVNESSETDKILQCLSDLTRRGVDIRCLVSTTPLPQDLPFEHTRTYTHE